jgi:hypothetical protein
MTLEQHFAGYDDSREVFEALRHAVADIGLAQLKVGKSQVTFRRRRTFAWAWMPGTYLHGPRPPLVVTVALRRHDVSPRWKEIVEPYPGRFIHHLELRAAAEVDDEVRAWLREAWEIAG